MKKLGLISIAVVVFIVIMMVNVSINIQEKKLPLTFANIEVLANTEDDTPVKSCPGGKNHCATVKDSSGGEKTYYKGN